jgi:hypothetical protein
MRIWNAETGLVNKFTISELPENNDTRHVGCTFNGAVVFIDAQTALVCASTVSDQKTAGCYTINVETGAYEVKADMTQARRCPGVCEHQGQVYVFGDHPPSSVAEVYSVSENSWSLLPESPQFQFTSCAAHGGGIFIANRDSTDIVIFSI